ncbi:MAG: T9SS type A sorting domain-containing protein, partial [Bacteroidetes bacterium]|nr:T9SS type A sorting domain-containing protein [Bacteroidota bacterium]
DSWTYEWDMVTDKDGNWHMFIQGYLDGTEATNLGIYELYSKTPGLTDLGIKKVADMTLLSWTYGTDALQTLGDIHAARDAEGKYVFVKYLDWDPTDAPETSTEVFVSGRAISSEAFVTPIAANDNDLGVQYFSQAAPRVSAKGAGDVAGTKKFQIHTSWVEFGGNPAAGTAAANVYYNGPTLDVAEYTGGSTPTDAKLTFVVNTAFVQDTVTFCSSVFISGGDQLGNWNIPNGIKLKNSEGDYWEGSTLVKTGTMVGSFKPVTQTASGIGWDRHEYTGFTVRNDTTIFLFATGLKDVYPDPITGQVIHRDDHWNPLELAKTGRTDVYAVHFRVNMEGITAFNSANHTVTVRGGFNGWSTADTLKPEIRHDDIGQTPFEAEKYFFSKTILIPKTSSGLLKYKFVWSDAGGVSTNWEDAIGGDRTFQLGKDTTLAWKYFDGGPKPTAFQKVGCGGNGGGSGDSKEFKISLTADLDKAINTNGFNKETDTLIARIGFLGTALKTVDVKFESPFVGTEYIGDTGSDSLDSEHGRVVFYRYYKKNAGGEFEEFYWDNYNTEPGASAPKFRKLTLPQSGNLASSEDILHDAVSSHRQPFFKNMDKLGDSTLFTLEVDLRPALFYTEGLGGILSDIQGGPLVVDSKNIRSLPIYINGPATGGWKPWNADSLGDSRKLQYNGRGQWIINIKYSPDATVSQEFKLSIGGADNEAGFGNHHIANLFQTATNVATVQFGDIQPLRYKLDDNNYWDFERQNCVRYGIECLIPHVGEGELPDKLSISAWPNPFNPATLISYSIPQSGKVSLKVFDLLGRQVAILSEEIKPAGMHQIPFRGDDLASGIYIVRMESGSKTESVKVILLK